MVKKKLFTMSNMGIFLICILLFSLFPKHINGYYDPDIPRQNQIIIQEKSDLIHFQPISDENLLQRYIVFGAGPISDITSAATNTMYEASSKSGSFAIGIFQQNAISSLKLKGYNVIQDIPLEFDSIQSKVSKIYDASRVDKILGVDKVIKNYGYTGKGIRIGIVDQGTDFSNPDMRNSVARDGYNIPVMIDADGQGLVLTNQTFLANINNYGVISNFTHPVPKGFTSYVYVTSHGIFLNLANNGQGTTIQVFNSNYPKGGTTVINGTVSNDYKIGKDMRHFIVSKSGIYHFGMIYETVMQGSMSRLQIVPVLVIDSKIPGVYDTIIPDMSDSWKDFMRFDSSQFPQYDFDFTNETPITLGGGKENLVYASNPKGNPDYSAGTVGARVLDLYGVFSNATKIDKKLGAINGTLLPPLDTKGNFFGVMYDFGGHGTATAASIVSQGKQSYNIYNNGTLYDIKGIAPDAKIVPIKALWLGDAIYGWLWAAGFDQDKDHWKFTGYPRVDILSNSWGISTFPALDSVPGFDVQSLLLSALDTPRSLDKNYPGILVVSSAGNAGPGYGTMGSPDAAPLGLTVGAATDNVYVGYGSFKSQPRFGNFTTYYGDVSGFSSKGPSVVADPKPDLMAIGEYAFTPTSITKFSKTSTTFSIFGGTSLAAPLAAGSASILMQALNEKRIDYDPFMIKNILMSSADDMYNDPFAQGSGLVNVTNSIDFVLGTGGMFIVSNNASYSNIKKVLDPAISTLNSSSVGLKMFQLTNASLPETSWFAGRLNPGDRTSATFTIENPTNDTINVDVLPQTISLEKVSQYNDTTKTLLQDPALTASGIFRPNYIPLAKIANHANYSFPIKENSSNPIPSDSSLMVLDLSFPFSEFLNSTTKTYADALKIASLYLYDWNTKNNKTTPTYKELSLINRGGAWGTVQELRVSEPNSRIKHNPIVGVYPVPTVFSYWSGDTKKNSTSLHYTLTASYFKKTDWGDIWVDTKSVIVKPHSSTNVTATLIVPNDQNPGVYQGFITFKGKSHTVNVPVSYVVLKKLQPKDLPTVIQGTNGTTLYGNGYVGGGFDMSNRYNAGDWREYFFDVKDNTINSVTMIISWKQSDTNLSVFMVDPQGKIIQTNAPPGILQLQGWPTGDWLGASSPFSEGGGFYPIKNKDSTSTVLYAPINQTGIYTVLIHTTLFGGQSITEPTTLYAKFSTILPQENAPEIVLDIPQFINSSYIISPKIVGGEIQDEKYYLDSIGPQTLNKTSLSASLTNLSDGTHDIKIVITDTVGHTSSSDFKFFLDDTPPVISFKSPGNGSTVSGILNVNLDVNELNPLEKHWLVINLPNETIFDNTTFQFDTRTLQNGPHYIEAVATDKAGNVAKEKIAINIDNAFPVANLGQNNSDQNFIILVEILVGIAIAFFVSVIVFKKIGISTRS